jgi:two-component system, NarL family, invasion response regulator UvrY
MPASASSTDPPPREPRGSPIRVLAVDDQAIFLRAVRQLLLAAPGFEQVGEARSGEEAIARLAELRPDLVLVDVRMPGMDGVETARRLLAQRPPPAVVLVSLEPLPEQETGLELPVAGFLRKQELSVRRLTAVWAEHRPGATAQRRV